MIDEATGEVIAQSGGGGGESDYTTAEVTVSGEFTDPVILSIPNIVTNGDAAAITNYAELNSEHNSVTLTVPLYKGYLVLTSSNLATSAGNPLTVSEVTGDIVNEGQVIVTGDGTITLSAAGNT